MPWPIPMALPAKEGILSHFQNTGFTVDIKYLNKENKDIIDNLNGYYNFVTGKKLIVEP